MAKNDAYSEWLQLVRKNVEAETRLVIRPLRGNEPGLRTAFCQGVGPCDLSQKAIWELVVYQGHRAFA